MSVNYSLAKTVIVLGIQTSEAHTKNNLFNFNTVMKILKHGPH